MVKYRHQTIFSALGEADMGGCTVVFEVLDGVVPVGEYLGVRTDGCEYSERMIESASVCGGIRSG